MADYFEILCNTNPPIPTPGMRWLKIDRDGNYLDTFKYSEEGKWVPVTLHAPDHPPVEPSPQSTLTREQT